MALARSSHLVVLMNELRKCIHCIPLLGVQKGDKGIGSIVEHDVFDRFYGDTSVKYRALKETIAKTTKHI